MRPLGFELWSQTMSACLFVCKNEFAKLVPEERLMGWPSRQDRIQGLLIETSSRRIARQLQLLIWLNSGSSCLSSIGRAIVVDNVKPSSFDRLKLIENVPRRTGLSASCNKSATICKANNWLEKQSRRPRCMVNDLRRPRKCTESIHNKLATLFFFVALWVTEKRS